jgi:hypothetical protein
MEEVKQPILKQDDEDLESVRSSISNTSKSIHKEKRQCCKARKKRAQGTAEVHASSMVV